MKNLNIYLSKFIIIVLSLLVNQSTYAGFDKLIKDVFPKGTMSNATAGGIVHEQAAGHLMGGSVIIKTPAIPGFSLVRAQSPSCKMGGLPCGAQIELIGGSLSLISSDELIQHIKNLPNNGGVFAAMTLVKTLSPQMETLMEFLDAKADQLNQMGNFNCHQMQSLIDPILPKAAAKDQALRQSQMILSGSNKDMADIQRKSKTTGAVKINHPELESQLGAEYNLVWKALSKKTASNSDGRELKELLMSISGTIIGKNGDGEVKSAKHLKSLVGKDLVKQFIGADGVDSNKIRIYVCDEPDKCLNPKITEKRITQGAFLFQRVANLLSGITQKIYQNRGALSGEEEALVALSPIPLLLRLEIDLATYSNQANVASNQTEFIEALCFDVVVDYLQSLLIEVQESVGELSFSQIADSSIFKSFDADTRDTMRRLSTARFEAKGRYDAIIQNKVKLRQEMNMFDKEFEDYIGNYNL